MLSSPRSLFVKQRRKYANGKQETKKNVKFSVKEKVAKWEKWSVDDKQGWLEVD